MGRDVMVGVNGNSVGTTQNLQVNPRSFGSSLMVIFDELD